VSGEVGEGGDHVNITFKNTGDQEVRITGSSENNTGINKIVI
jgi:hypothetical protein